MYKFVLKIPGYLKYLIIFVSYTQQDESTIVERQAVEYPTYHEVPSGLSFTCAQRGPGYYADPQAQCQVCTLVAAICRFYCLVNKNL